MDYAERREPNDVLESHCEVVKRLAEWTMVDGNSSEGDQPWKTSTVDKANAGSQTRKWQTIGDVDAEAHTANCWLGGEHVGQTQQGHGAETEEEDAHEKDEAKERNWSEALKTKEVTRSMRRTDPRRQPSHPKNVR